MKYLHRFMLTALSVILLISRILLPRLSLSDDEVYGDVSGVMYESCYDGDTCRFDIPGWPDVIGKDIAVRLSGVDTPEIRGFLSVA